MTGAALMIGTISPDGVFWSHQFVDHEIVLETDEIGFLEIIRFYVSMYL